MEKTVWASVPTGTPCVVFNEGGTAVLRTYVGMVLGRPHFDDGVWENATPVMDALNSVSRDYMDTCKSLQVALAYNEQLEARIQDRERLAFSGFSQVLEEVLEILGDPGEPKCTCHSGMPPCSDCVDNSGTRAILSTIYQERARFTLPPVTAALPPDLAPLDPLDPLFPAEGSR